jgi:NAD(P)-dependent dehydrogenase (short-subunit alcohol dehydrogenase family)
MATILVTGANRGIGLGLATLLAERGDHVVATARDPAAATALNALGARYPGLVEVLPLDVTDAASVAALAARLGERAIDALVNNAGSYGPKRQAATDMDFDGFAETLAINTIAPLRVANALLPHLGRAAGMAKILTITSRMGSLHHGGTGAIAYRTSKAAVNKAMQGLSLELKPRGMIVAVAHPGWVRTDMGGPDADLAVETSAEGLVAILYGLRIEDTGRFFDIDGRTIPW